MSGSQGKIGPGPLWRNGSFHLLWSSTLASGLGDRLATFIALALLGFAGEGADDSAITAGLEFFFFLPYLLWSPLAGWLSDRLPRRLVLTAADELRGLIVLSALFLLPEGHTGAIPETEHWKVYGFMGMIGMMAATFVPAKFSVLPAVVGDAMLTRANGAVVTMGIIGNLAGFFFGGWLAEKSIPAAVVVCAACYMVSGLFWLMMKMRFEGHGMKGRVTLMGVLREIREGGRYAVKHRPVFVLILTAAMLWTATSVYMPALAAINKLVFEGDTQSFGVLAGGLGLGMIIGAFALAILNTRYGGELMMVVGLCGAAVSLSLQMVVPWYGVSVALSVCSGIFASMLMVPLNTLIQRIVPNYLRGRVFAAKEVFVEFGKVVVSLMIWRGSGWFGVQSMEPLMKPVTLILACAFLLGGAYGFWRYVLTGPIAGKALNLFWRFSRWLSEAVHHLHVEGRGRVPRSGPVLVVANHRSGVDPVLIQSAIPRLITWMMAREYMFAWMNWFWKRTKPIGVKRDEKDSSAAREAVERLRNGAMVGIFPEGGIRQGNGELARLNPGVVMLAKRSGAKILPAWIDGAPVTGHPMRAVLTPSRSRVTFGETFVLDQAMDRKAALDEIKRRIEALAPRKAPHSGPTTKPPGSGNGPDNTANPHDSIDP